MRVKVWGARGSVPAPGPETTRYGGNTTCVQVTLADGSDLVLDAGTGIRMLGQHIETNGRPINLLLTHLHLDHIQGLLFFAPIFNPESEIVVWGPSSADGPLRERIARYLSAPLSPVEVRELPCRADFRECEPHEWEIGGARIRTTSVAHRGPTLGYRIDDTDGASLAFIPDHEPALGTGLRDSEDEWISGLELARDASLLVHDAQYTDAEYPLHLGWGHSAVSDALMFAERARAERTLLFHHDPNHTDDMLDAIASEVDGRAVVAREGDVLDV